MKLTLITPSFNHAEFLGETIDSVREQQLDVDLDYIVLDGGSNDGTIGLLESYGDQVQWSSKPDNGQVDAINRGLASATGDVVGWLNSDDLLLPGALQRVADAFANSSTQWVFGDCIIVDRDGHEIRKWVSAYKRFQAKRYSRKRLLMNNFISQMTVFWRRDLIDKVGLLDESLPLAFDYEYWLRFAAIADPVYIDAPQAAFRWYTTSKSGGNVADQCREDELIAARHGITSAGAAKKRLQNWLRIAAYRWLPA
ncbi:MAG: glycosyltransferase family 2 protein [Pirellulaceae bacterium]|nr:glycosyltransferase family 2 protein [Pirellulaceae bacterium]